MRSFRRFLGIILLAAGCASAPPPAPPPPAPDGPAAPPGTRPGAFSWRDVRGGQDRIDAFRDLRDRTLAVFEEAARFPRPGGGAASSPAAREIPAVRAAFDETRAAEELEARVVYFDRERDPPAGRPEVPAEGIEITLRRLVPRERPRELVLTVEDLAVGGRVDGQADRIALRWTPADLVIVVEADQGQIVSRVEFGGEEGYRVTSPHLGALLARTQNEVYKPLGGNAFARAIREGTAPLRVRPSAPEGTSFTAAPESPH